MYAKNCMSKKTCYVNSEDNVMLDVYKHFAVEVAKYCNIDHHSSLILIATVV